MGWEEGQRPGEEADLIRTNFREIKDHYEMSTSNCYIQYLRKSEQIMLKTVIKTHFGRNRRREGSIVEFLLLFQRT